MVSIGRISADRGRSHRHSNARTRVSPPKRRDGKEPEEPDDDFGSISGPTSFASSFASSGVGVMTTVNTEPGVDALCVSSRLSLASRRLRAYPG